MHIYRKIWYQKFDASIMDIYVCFAKKLLIRIFKLQSHWWKPDHQMIIKVMLLPKVGQFYIRLTVNARSLVFRIMCPRFILNYVSLTSITLNSLILMLNEVISSTGEILSLLDMNLSRFHIQLFVFIIIFLYVPF